MHVRQSLWPTNRLFYFRVKAAVTTSEQTGVPVFQENSAQMTRSHTLPMGRSLPTLSQIYMLRGFQLLPLDIYHWLRKPGGSC